MRNSKQSANGKSKNVKRGNALHDPEQVQKPNPPRPAKKSDNPKIIAIVQARKETEKQKRAHRKFVMEMIATACGIGEDLMNDKEAWLEFCAMDWGKLKGPSVDHRDQAIRFALKFVFAKGKKGEKRASFYFNAVKELIRKGRKGKALVKAIQEAGGLKKLQKHNAAKSKTENGLGSGSSTSKASITVGDSVSEDVDEEDLSDTSNDETAGGSKRTTGKNAGVARVSPSNQHDPTVEMLFKVVFPQKPTELTKSKLPARISLKGQIVEFGRTSIIKVDSYRLKKPKP